MLPAEVETINARVPRHATLDSLLRQHELAVGLVQAAVKSAAGVFNPRNLRAERPYRLVRSFDGVLREFEYQIDADNFLRIFNPDHKRPGELQAAVVPIEKHTEVAAVRASIDDRTNSLIAALDAAGEKIQLALALAEIFSGSIDFNSDLQPGDGFEVVFEKSTHAGEFAGYGAILGARFVADGREHQAFRWTDPATGKSAYYDENGRSLRRFFLKSPLRFEPRITSGFSLRRLHPVHGTYRAHLGVDYGAPHGSAVVSVAAGVVVSAGWAGGGGNQVRLRHAGGYESYYLHLSRFGKGIRAGTRVDQGEVIGFVGVDRHRDRPAPRLPPAPERRLREPARRARAAPAGRADRRRAPGGLPPAAGRHSRADGHGARRIAHEAGRCSRGPVTARAAAPCPGDHHPHRPWTDRGHPLH